MNRQKRAKTRSAHKKENVAANDGESGRVRFTVPNRCYEPLFLNARYVDTLSVLTFESGCSGGLYATEGDPLVYNPKKIAHPGILAEIEHSVQNFTPLHHTAHGIHDGATIRAYYFLNMDSRFKVAIVGLDDHDARDSLAGQITQMLHAKFHDRALEEIVDLTCWKHGLDKDIRIEQVYSPEEASEILHPADHLGGFAILINLQPPDMPINIDDLYRAFPIFPTNLMLELVETVEVSKTKIFEGTGDRVVTPVILAKLVRFVASYIKPDDNETFRRILEFFSEIYRNISLEKLATEYNYSPRREMQDTEYRKLAQKHLCSANTSKTLECIEPGLAAMIDLELRINLKFMLDSKLEQPMFLDPGISMFRKYCMSNYDLLNFLWINRYTTFTSSMNPSICPMYTEIINYMRNNLIFESATRSRNNPRSSRELYAINTIDTIVRMQEDYLRDNSATAKHIVYSHPNFAKFESNRIQIGWERAETEIYILSLLLRHGISNVLMISKEGPNWYKYVPTSDIPDFDSSNAKAFIAMPDDERRAKYGLFLEKSGSPTLSLLYGGIVDVQFILWE
jgi:hypothetical protein